MPKVDLHNFEGKQIIGTELYEPFQRMVSLCGDIEVHKAKMAGLPVTGISNGFIVREYPDGREEIIGKAPERVKVTQKVYKLPKSKWKRE